MTLRDMDSEGCLYPSSRGNLSTDLGCAFFALVSSANFLHVHSTKHVWCVTALRVKYTLSRVFSTQVRACTVSMANSSLSALFDTSVNGYHL